LQRGPGKARGRPGLVGESNFRLRQSPQKGDDLVEIANASGRWVENDAGVAHNKRRPTDCENLERVFCFELGH